jgi:uncharacterized damage-inducible protein DinB
MLIVRSLAATAALACVALPAAAQSAANTVDYRSEALAEIDARAQRYIALAEAIPADKYTWRPAEGVHSVSEVLMHVAAANYFLTARLGTEAPTGLAPQGFETSSTDKAEVIRHVRASFDHLRSAVRNAPADPNAAHPWFGGRTISNSGIGMFHVGHHGEHLGQLIAYARMNGIRPPWSGE